MSCQLLWNIPWGFEMVSVCTDLLGKEGRMNIYLYSDLALLVNLNKKRYITINKMCTQNVFIILSYTIPICNYPIRPIALLHSDISN